MSNSAIVLRARDLAYFQLELINLALDDPSSSSPMLKRGASGPAYIVLRLPPQHIAEEAMLADGPTPDLPYRAFLSCPSRLAFEVPSAITAIPFRLDDILQHLTEWAMHAPIASSGSEPSTVIEFPDRLLLIPDQGVRLKHRSAPPLQDTPWSQLWHTRMQASGGEAAPRIGLRAILNPADTDRFPASARTTLTKGQRADIVAHCDRAPGPGIAATEFILSALGATARLKSNWPPNAITLQSWEQDSVFGRDQYVETVERGYLFPFGHKATLTTISQREVASSIAGLVQHSVVTVQEVERRYDGASEQGYPHVGREMPLKSVRIARGHSQSVGRSGGVPLNVTATDARGNEINFSVTMFFVTAADSVKDAKLTELAARFAPGSTVQLMRQHMALADNSLAGGDTAAAVETLDLDVQRTSTDGPIQPPFLPLMRGAKVSVPAIEHLLGSEPGSVAGSAPDAMAMTLHPHFLANGFSPVSNPKQVYAQFQGAIPGLKVPAERAGGLAAPRFPPIDGLSRTLGPVAGVQKLIDDRPISPAELIGGTKLLGVIPLSDLLAEVRPSSDAISPNDFESLYENLDSLPSSLTQPLLTSIGSGSAFETRFLWKPKIKDGALPPPIKRGDGGPLQLVMKGRIRKRADARDAFDVEGVLTNFQLSFADLLTIDFDRVGFKSSVGKKMQVDLGIKGFAFGDGLAFVKPILQLLSAAGLGNALSIEPRPDGVVATYSVGIPSFGLGAANLENIALSSSISLPFVEDKPAAVRVALSERSRPFLVSVFPLGGTGFFAIEVRTDKSARVEGAIEFGGVLAINLLDIVKGGLYAFAGIYISVESGTETSHTLFSGFVRWGGYADVLGLISVSIEFYVALSYVPDTKILEAEARLTIGVKVLFFHESFGFTVKQRVANFGALPADIVTLGLVLQGSGAAPANPITEAQWADYCHAFA